MKPDLPTTSELLRTVREYLEGIQSVVPDHERYGALCCIHLLSILERELAASNTNTADESYAIETLLDTSVGASDANLKLSQALRAGTLDARWQEAFDLVLKQVVNKVWVTKPDFLEAQHRSTP